MPSEIYLKQLQKEREIGIDPIFFHSRGTYNWDVRQELSREWQKRSKKWDQDNPSEAR